MKRRKKPVSAAGMLAYRFSLLIAAIIIVVAFAIIMLLRFNVRMQQHNELVSAMEKIAAMTVDSAREPPPGIHMTLPSQGGRGMPKPFFPDVPYYITYTVYKGSSSEIMQTNDPFLPQLPPTGGRTKPYSQKDYYIDGDLNILYCSKEYEPLSHSAFTVQAALNMDRDTSSQLLAGMPRMLLIIFLPLLAVSFFAALIITKRTLSPVVEMTRAARQTGSTNLDQRLPVTGKGDELDTLASTFNDLFARLKKDFDRERQFTSNVSHELKTPLAVILGHANLIRRWGRNDAVQLEKSITALITESHTMESIITNLLQLSRIESGTVKPHMQEIPLLQLLHRLEDDTHAWSKDIVFNFDAVPGGVIVTADMELLYQTCTIIISNSVKFSPAPVQITAAARKQEGSVIITITDNGTGIEPEILPHIFERFYRGDPSHNRNAGGSGLGLSIAKVIMDVMHGSISAGNASEGGAVLTLTLPAVQE